MRAPSTLPVLLLAVAACGGQAADGVLPIMPGPKCPEAPAAAATSTSATAQAEPVLAPRVSDEGMWLLNAFPSELVAKKYGFGPTQAWLDHVRLASVRLTLGCSGSIVSPNGLVMTNHHCASECLTQLSTASKDLIAKGYLARTEKEELRCPDMEVNELVDISDVTGRLGAATKSVADKDFHAAKRAETAKIEKECATGDDVRCEVVDLYHGGKYHLYKYRRFQDIRIVFAPELATAFFGGDPDNFNFPRYDLDVTFLRIYDKDKPAKLDHSFKWSKAGPKEGDLTFVSGHPGGTSRLLTTSQLVYQRDVALPEHLARLAEERGVVTEFQTRGKEQRRYSSDLLFELENSLKAIRGMHASLDPALMAQKAAEERAVVAHVAADPALAKEIGGAWDAIAKAEEAKRRLAQPYMLLEGNKAFATRLFTIARTLVRAADELKKPNGERLEEYGDSHLPGLRQELFSTAPIYADLEALTFGMSLTRLRERLGADDAVVRLVLGKDAPKELALALVKGTKLGDPKVRKALFEGGKAAVDASKDPMIELARRVDADARAARKAFEEEVIGVEQRNGELIARARFATFGTSVYPDATFTLRLAYGTVKGWDEGGKPVAPFTTFRGAFDRATGKDPFALPKSWLDAKSKLALDTPLDFVTTNDIIGGNSGSPMINKDAEIVGLIFDGNIHSLGGDYWFDDAKNRAVAVDSAALVEALDKIYGAGRLVAELQR